MPYLYIKKKQSLPRSILLAALTVRTLLVLSLNTNYFNLLMPKIANKSKVFSCHLAKYQVRNKNLYLNLIKRIVDAHKAEEYIKILKCFQVSRNGVRSIIKKGKEIQRLKIMNSKYY